MEAREVEEEEGEKGILGWRGKDSRVFLLDPVNRNQESKRERFPAVFTG